MDSKLLQVRIKDCMVALDNGNSNIVPFHQTFKVTVGLSEFATQFKINDRVRCFLSSAGGFYNGWIKEIKDTRCVVEFDDGDILEVPLYNIFEVYTRFIFILMEPC